MSTIKYNTQYDEVSVAEVQLPSENDLIERKFKCVSINRLRSLSSSRKLKGMIIDGLWQFLTSCWYQSLKMIRKVIFLFVFGIVIVLIIVLGAFKFKILENLQRRFLEEHFVMNHDSWLGWFTVFKIFSVEYCLSLLELRNNINNNSGLLWVDWCWVYLVKPCDS